MTMEIDTVEAKRLRGLGKSWARVGIELAEQRGRKYRFWGESVIGAILRENKRARDEQRARLLCCLHERIDSL